MQQKSGNITYRSNNKVRIIDLILAKAIYFLRMSVLDACDDEHNRFLRYMAVCERQLAFAIEMSIGDFPRLGRESLDCNQKTDTVPRIFLSNWRFFFWLPNEIEFFKDRNFPLSCFSEIRVGNLDCSSEDG